MPRNNTGYDIRSYSAEGHYVFIEVKGRILGAENFIVTRNEVLFGRNADRYRLALVSVAPGRPGAGRGSLSGRSVHTDRL